MLLLPPNRLPVGVHERHARLRDYFLDKDAAAIPSADGWRLTLDWPEGEERHVDPRLAEGLAWWGEGVTRGTMALQNRRAGPILTALYDTWTLVSWSDWLARQDASPGHLTILHIDDHRDLGSPRLFREDGVLRDGITGAVVDLWRPDTVRAALLSGAIGMGSFMTPFLHAFPLADVRHLCQPPKAVGTADFDIGITTEPDTLLEPGIARPAVRLSPSNLGMGPGRYRITSSVARWLEGVRSGPALLHIDMDYFNNRYDGDSAWAEVVPAFDPSLDQILAKIDELVAAVSQPGLPCRVDDVVVAYSPGFFPAEYWSAADTRLRAGLERLHES